MIIELSTDLIFLGIVVCYSLAGAKKGGIMSIGGLIAAILSWILSKMFALPLTAYIFSQTSLESKIISIISVFNSGMLENTNKLLPNMDFAALNGFWGVSEKLTNMVSGIVNQSALNICTMFTSVILFGALMLAFGVILKLFQKVLEQIPMGKIANSLLGIACGAVKGLILAAIVYMVFYIINICFNANMPLNETYVGQLLEIATKFHF